MFSKHSKLGIAGFVAAGVLACSLMASSASAQVDHSFAIGDATAPREGTAVTELSWVSGGDVENVTIRVTFDPTRLSPSTTTVAGNERVDGCVSGLPASHTGLLTGCQLNAPGQIDLVISDQSGEGTPLPSGVIGSITFTVAAQAAFGETPVSASIQQASSDFGATDLTERVGAEGGVVNVVDLTAVLNVQPNALPFGNQQVNTASSPAFFTISNDGTDEIDLTVSALGLPSGAFARSGGTCPGTLPFTLADGASCTVGVVFTPTDTTDFDATITVVSNAGSVTNDQVRLTGTGTPGPQSTLSITGSPVSFGSVDLNDLPSSFTVTATNDGDTGSSLTISAVNYTGDDAFSITNGCAGTSGVLATGQSCSVIVTFDTDETGTFSGTVAFTSNADNTPNPEVAVTGTSTATAVIAINPPFGPVGLGSAAPGETLSRNGVVTNSGSAAADVSCVLNDETGVFSTTPSPLAATVAANSTVDFTLSCALPVDGVEGDTYAATLTCSVDQEVAGTHELSCGVTEFEPLPVPTMSNWSIAFFALLMLLVGGFSIRFFRV